MAQWRWVSTVRPAMAAAVVATAVALAGCGTADSGPTGDTPENGTPDHSASAAPTSPTGEFTVERYSYTTRGTSDPQQNHGDFYLPTGKHAVDTVPLVVLIHGGSWQSKIGFDTMSFYAADLARRGMAVYNIEYRRVGSGGGWPTTFTDVADALDYVPEIDKKHPEITTDDELVVGHSAGAQLAVWAGTRNKLTANEVGSKPAFRPTRVVSLAGPLDMIYAAHHGDDRIVTALGGTPEQVPERYTSVDPIQNIDPQMPVVAIHGDKDNIVSQENSKRYIDAVDKKDGIGDLVIATGENHVSIVSPDSRVYQKILDIIGDASSKTIDQLDDLYS